MQRSAQKNKSVKISPELFRQKLKLKHLQAKKAFKDKYPEVDKFLAAQGVDLSKLREHSAKIIGAGIFAGSLILNSLQHDASKVTTPKPISSIVGLTSTAEIKDPKEILTTTFSEVLPKQTRPLSREEEKFLENVISNLTGVPAKASLEGEHLNTTYGRIGLEQHLRRFPGDTIDEHGEGFILRQGLAPGLGAWGYFAKSRAELTPELEETERWYAVVQTLYLPDWNTRQPHLKNWYKYRKVLIVNTVNGNAVVASIADSGPAAWTGKHYGGSPEVMHHLGGDRYTKGPVILFFVDDPENKVPLGPVDYDEMDQSKLVLSSL